MGFKQVDLVPVGTNGPTAITPTSKGTDAKIFQVTRTDTVAVTKVILPADTSILEINIHGSTVSNAATTATVTVTVSNNTGVISTGTVDVKANGATSALVQMTALPNIEPLPLLGDLLVQAVYAETGTASTSGGPWVFDIEFVR